MKQRKRLIETRLPLIDIDEEAAREKNGRAPTFELLFWWTRKPLVVSRAAVLASLLPEDYSLEKFRMELGFGRDKGAFNYSPNIKGLSKFIVKTSSSMKIKLLDPMAGGGSIPFEALRCGVDAVAVEYNPVAYIILKATLEYPKKYGPQLAEDVETWGKEVLRRAQEEIGHLYPRHGKKQVSHYIWCWTAKCQRCHQENPLMSQWWLVKTKRTKIGLKPVIKENRDFDIDFTKSPPKAKLSRGQTTCLRCGAPITNELVRREVASGKRRLICVVVSDKDGKKYEKPTQLDFHGIEEANKFLKKHWKEFEEMGLIPSDEVPGYDTRSIWCVPYGIDKWHKLYSTRQLVTMITLAKHIRKIGKEIESRNGKEYAKVIVTYLAITLCQHARFNSLPTRWVRTREVMGKVFDFRGISLTWDHAEVNTFANGSGTWKRNLSGVTSAIKFASKALDKSADLGLHLGSALKLPIQEKFDLIVTDPPYLDDVPYGELSEFYHVWLWRLLHDYDSELPGPKVPVDEELDHNPGRHGSEDLSREFYVNGLTESLREMKNALVNNGLLVLFFAHSKLEAWKILISSLIDAGFRVTMAWPVRTESPTSVVQRGKASIQSSILVAARKREGEGTAFLEDLRDEVASHVMKSLSEISDLALTGADLIVAGLGKALEVATSYSKLKSYSGNATLESLLEVVSEAVYSYSVERLVKRPLAALDPQTAFYVFVKCGYGGLIPPDDALMICKGAGVELRALQHDKIIDKKKIGTRTILATLNAYERNLDPEKPPRTPSIVDQLHLLELAVQKYGKKGFNKLVSSPTFRAGDVRAVAEGLYNGLLRIRKDDPEIELLRPIIDLFKAGAPSPSQDTIDKYFTKNE
jgi:adenine-specific DNA methylase